MKAKELTKEQKKARIKELQTQIKATKKRIKELQREQAKALKQRAKQGQNLTPEQQQILKLTEDVELLKYTVRTLILKDIETIKALKTYEKMINVIVEKLAETQKKNKDDKRKK